MHARAKHGRVDQHLPVSGGASVRSEMQILAGAPFVRAVVLPIPCMRDVRVFFRFSHFKNLLIVPPVYKVDGMECVRILCWHAIFL